MNKRLTYTSTATTLQSLAHPSRLQILDELRRGEACVCHLQAVLERPQVYVSKQLRVLRDAGIVADTKDGLNVYYQITNLYVLHLLDEILGPAQPAQRVEGCSCPRCTGERRHCD